MALTAAKTLKEAGSKPAVQAPLTVASPSNRLFLPHNFLLILSQVDLNERAHFLRLIPIQSGQSADVANN